MEQRRLGRPGYQSSVLIYGGARLGLAIVRGRVKARRGDISLANDGPGCRVLVRLPAGAQT